jgi:homopolymeric O-antigen transport system permease protein
VSAATAPESSAVTVIEPPKGAAWPDWRELWAHRELAWVLARRDVAVRYKQSAIGALWAVVQPLSLAAVFSLFFGLLAHIDSGTDVPYPVFAVLGMVTWLFFSSALNKVASSTVVSGPLISKVYFPRMVIPISAVFAPLVDFGIGMAVALVVTLAYGVVPPVQVVLLPLVVPLLLAVILGFGFWLAAVHVKYRDIGNVVTFALLLGLFITPIVYPFSNIPEAYQALYGLNPMVGVLELVRWMVLPGSEFPGGLLAITIVESVVLIVSGSLYFGRAQRSFADVI